MAILLIAVAVICVVVIVCSYLTNNFTTPVKKMEKYANKEAVKYEKASIDYLNGFAASDFKNLFKALHNSEYYEEMLEEFDEINEKSSSSLRDTYGEDCHVKYEITDKTKLEASELKNYKDVIQDFFGIYTTIADEAEDFDSGDWSSFADDLEMSKGDAKALVKILGEIGEKYSRVKVSDGYELEVTKTITGSELEDPKEEDMTVVVLNVNGRWVSITSFSYIFRAFDNL